MNKPRILFAARGSARDGLGHIVRSRSVALKLKDAAEVHFAALGDHYVEQLLADEGLTFTVHRAASDLAEVGARHAPDVVVFDMLRLDEEAFRQVSEGAFTVSLSPIFDRLDRVDVLFHRTRPPEGGWPEGLTVRAGFEYAVVGDHCSRISRESYVSSIDRDKLSVAVSMGGTDSANKSLRVLRALKRLKRPLLLWVLLGEGYMHSYQDLVDELHGSRHEIILAKTTDSMWRILEQCALAVLAGGTTTYEAAFAGLPSLNTLEKGSDSFLVDELVDKGVALKVGTNFDESLLALPGLLEGLGDDPTRLVQMHDASKGLIDGMGAQRIANEILGAHEARLSST